MKKVILLAWLLQIVIYPNYKGIQGEVDYSRPAIVIDKDEVYQTIPGTTERDYTKPSYTIEDKRPDTRRHHQRYIIDMEDPLE